MLSLTLNSVRRLPPALRLRLQVAYARAWEALTDTHQTQAAMFVVRLADRLPLEEALSRYFREVAVPVAMRETVRARALLAVADAVPAVPATDPADPWQRLRPDRLVGAVRRRAQWVEETTLRCRMTACLAEGAVTATHTRMAVQVAELLADVVPADEALMTYIRSFDLPLRDGDAVFRAALAELADRRLWPEEKPVLRVEQIRVPEREAPAVPPLPPVAFGLRVIV
ncbi:MAG TPA: hypothetical protein VK688_03095 [Gemmatimonadales bacterium]|jgi:hypothetical protein|nr:hypothetical protein [Gemmatimonadales bacterium]